MLEWRRLTLVENDEFPAQSRKDIIVYRNAVDPDAADCAEQFEALFTENGWHLEWRGRISDTGHFHSRAHEIIAIVKGSTILALGGGKGKRVVLDVGDAVLILLGFCIGRRVHGQVASRLSAPFPRVSNGICDGSRRPTSRMAGQHWLTDPLVIRSSESAVLLTSGSKGRPSDQRFIESAL